MNAGGGGNNDAGTIAPPPPADRQDTGGQRCVSKRCQPAVYSYKALCCHCSPFGRFVQNTVERFHYFRPRQNLGSVQGICIRCLSRGKVHCSTSFHLVPSRTLRTDQQDASSHDKQAIPASPPPPKKKKRKKEEKFIRSLAVARLCHSWLTPGNIH